ncbi:MAG TPA: hypothetical protein VFF65_07960 [Phycisphaerales bacterium]|nr:hypothetical protein [Phycisphaerales bacterium]
MTRAVALILSLVLVLLPAAARPQASAAAAEPDCCCSTDGQLCPLCEEVRSRTGSCPCSPGPQRQSRSTTDQERAALAVKAAGQSRSVARWARRGEPEWPALPASIVRALVPLDASDRPAERATLRSAPLRAALCIWTT